MSGDSLRLSGPTVTALAFVGLALVGTAGGAAAAILTEGGSGVVTHEVTSDSPIAQAGLMTSTTAVPMSAAVERSAQPATSTASAKRHSLPSSTSKDSTTPVAPAVPAAAAPPVRVVPAPAPPAYRPAPAQPPNRPAPAPAPAPPPEPPPLTIDLGGRGHFIPPPPVAPRQ